MVEEDRKGMSEWKKALRTEIYYLKREARRFFNIEGVVRIRGEKWWDKSTPKKEEKEGVDILDNKVNGAER